MKPSDYIIEVSEASFEYDVIAYSRQTPVVVDFWAEWCGPCRSLGPLLERLAQEAQGAFRLAKVNVDDNPNLALRFSVRSIPAVKAFRDGRMVSEFVGAQPEERIREFLRAIAPNQNDLQLEKAQGLAEMQQWANAEAAFRQFLSKHPGYPPALLGLAKALLAQGKIAEGRKLLVNFPASKEYHEAEKLRPLAEALERPPIPTSENPLDAAYTRSLNLFTRGNLEASMDGLLDILRDDRNYRKGEPRKVMLGIFEILGENHPTTRVYRAELASVLF
ncbi:MAG: thioredoxin [Chloroflexota bacterium]